MLTMSCQIRTAGPIVLKLLFIWLIIYVYLCSLIVGFRLPEDRKMWLKCLASNIAVLHLASPRIHHVKATYLASPAWYCLLTIRAYRSRTKTDKVKTQRSFFFKFLKIRKILWKMRRNPGFQSLCIKTETHYCLQFVLRLCLSASLIIIFYWHV